MTLRLRSLCRVVELVKLSYWALGAVAIRLLIFWKDARVFNADSWRIRNDCVNFRMLWPYINGGFIAMEFILQIFCPFWCITEIYVK